MARITDQRLHRLEKQAGPQAHEKAIDRETFGRMSTADLLTFERTFQRVDDAGEDALTPAEWASFEAAAERFFQLRGEVRAGS
jgi:hypothetical protein